MTKNYARVSLLITKNCKFVQLASFLHVEHNLVLESLPDHNGATTQLSAFLKMNFAQNCTSRLPQIVLFLLYTQLYKQHALYTNQNGNLV